MNRRQFLEQLALMGICATMPVAGKAGLNSATDAPRYLILVELNGGNDGLNNVVPFREEQYYQLRPNIGIKADSVIQLSDELGLHPALKPFYSIWQQGDLALINGVGYPDPNRSHFRSIEIWETASAANETLATGWLTPIAQALPVRNHSGIKAVALADDQGPFAGDMSNSVVFDDLPRFIRQAKGLKTQQSNSTNPALQHVLQIRDATQKAANDFAANLSQLAALPDDWPKSPFARRLGTVARLIQSRSGPQIFKLSHGSFDTHANQPGNHNRLLRELSGALSALRNVLNDADMWNDTVVMTYSEFGRRVKENASRGTDHGTAAVQFVMGGQIKGGLHGEQPSLSALIDGDLEYKVDFRSLYNTIARDWLRQTDLPRRLNGFAKLDLFT